MEDRMGAAFGDLAVGIACTFQDEAVVTVAVVAMGPDQTLIDEYWR